MTDVSDEETETQEVADEETETREVEAKADGVATLDEEVVLDLESAEEYEQRIDDLVETVEQQQEQIEELESLMLDLSTRVADGRDIGVCADCHGPVERIRRWFRPSVIKCRRCGEVYHEY